MLQFGVLVAAVVTVIGGALLLVQHGSARADYSRLSRRAGAPHVARRHCCAARWTLAASRSSSSGFVLLIATPVARVAFTLVAFVLQRDRTYVAITAIVLALLLYGLLFGPSMKRHHAVVRITHWVNVDRADDHDRERAAHLQRVSGVRAARRDVLLLSVRAHADSRRAHVRRLARRRAQLAFRDDVGARA